MIKSTNSNNIIRQLQIVFSISIVVLLLSLYASFFSVQRLIDNSKLVNHTHEVLIQADNIISYMKDAETGQRGFIITHDRDFLTPYQDAYEKVSESYKNVRDLTVDNPIQQTNIAEINNLVQQKFAQMKITLTASEKGKTGNVDSLNLYKQMLNGRKIMLDLRSAVERVKNEEKRLLEVRSNQQNKYINASPFFLLFASIISILITAFAYIKIKKDLDKRVMLQQELEDTHKNTTLRILQIESVTNKISQGDYTARSSDTGKDELGKISNALNKVIISFENVFNDLTDTTWLQTGAAQLSDAARGQKDISKLSSNIINTISEYIKAPLGTVYIKDDFTHAFKLQGSYGGVKAPRNIPSETGLIAQCAINKKTIIIDVPDNYANVNSSLGQTKVTCLILLPLVYDYDCIGVIEVGLLKQPTPLEIQFLETNLETMAVNVNAAQDNYKLQNLLEETQSQSEELQAQHNELENSNHELEVQSQKLQASEEELRVQQEELMQSNTELEERGALLEERNSEIQKKALEIQQTSKYKSEFLANMSHELRTPLNSILLLSRLLAENNEKTLNEEQVEFASVIQNSGQGLLALIDEILDLSKIESGKMEMDYFSVSLSDVAEDINSLFKTIAKEKKLELNISLGQKLPATIETDKARLEQILKNLISNSLKFTSKGSVSLQIITHPEKENTISFIVKDTGIGIAPEKQNLIFEAFQQADGSTKRKYGGTGLGLSISRELAKLLGGEITLESTPGEGSTFTLFLPHKKTTTSAPEAILLPELKIENVTPRNPAIKNEYITTFIPENIPDDREIVNEKDKVILIIEDDTNFAKSLLEYSRKKGYKGIVAVRGDEGITLAGIYNPMGILLDIQLPVKSGWEVMDELKADPKTRQIPVHMMSSLKLKNKSLIKGAIDFIDKPFAFEQMDDVFKKIEYVLNRKSKKVLIIEDNPKHAQALAYFLESSHIHSELNNNITEGIERLKRKDVDCVILDMGIPDANAYAALEEAKKNPELENLPIIVFTGKSLSMAEELKIKKYADSIVVKTAHSYQRMLDEVSLFLHLVQVKKDPQTIPTTPKLGELSDILEGKTVLITDDDIRNIFAISKALENYKMKVVTAINGKEAIKLLEENNSIDIILLDMMMPEMDGYETAQKIRSNPAWKKIPVIAVTAKAMSGDRDKCINAGASDYITKPIDLDQMMSLLRVWLYESV